jgi:hypothetical protein
LRNAGHATAASITAVVLDNRAAHIAFVLKQVEGGAPVVEVCRRAWISVATV